MALTKITPQMFDTSATAHDLNVDNGTFVVDGSASRVGIGTTTPSTLLDVDGTATATTFVGALTGNVTGTILTAAQTNITSLGTLSALTVTGTSTLGVVDASSFTDIITNTIYTASGSLDIDTVLTGRDVTFTQGSTNLMIIKGDASGTTVTGTLTGSDILLNDSGNNERSLRVQNSTVSSYLGVEGSSANRFVGSAANNMFLGTTTSDGIEFATNNNVRAIIDSGGNVGIGELNPSSIFHVKTASGTHRSRFESGNSHSLIRLIAATGSNAGLEFYSGAGNVGNITADGSSNLLFEPGGAEKMRIQSGGNVGIGTQGPNYKLEVNGTAHVVNTLTAGAIGIPSQGITLNQGFGTGVPTITMLGTAANGRAGAIMFQEQGAANTAAIYSTDGGTGNGSYGGLTIATYQSDLRFATNGLASTRMIIDSSGNVGIGTTSAPAGLPLQTKVSSGDNKLRMTTANKDAFILELKDATGDVHLGTNTTAGALVIEDDGDVYVGGNFAVNNAPISGTQVYIKKLDGSTNLMRWGEGTSTASTYRFRIDQNFDFIANSGSGDNFAVKSSNGRVSIGHGSPAHSIHVKGPVSNTGGVIAAFDATDSTNAWLQLKNSNSGNSWQIGSVDAGMRFYNDETAAYSALTIASNGNIGIGTGTTAPTTKLRVVSTGSATYSGSSAGSNIALHLANLESGAAGRTIGIGMSSESNAEVYLNCRTNSINNGGDFVIANRHAGGRSERHIFTSDGRQIKHNASIVSNHPGYQMNLGYVPHSAAYGSGTTSGVYLHMKMAQRSGGNSSITGINVMSRYEYKGYGYGGGFLHSGMSFYTYSGTSTPYGVYTMNNGNGNGMSAYYSTDSYVVIVVHIVANNYTGGVLYFQSGITHRLADNQITSINYSNSTTGVF